jgi:hypothetical protein
MYKTALPELWVFRVFINLKSTPYSPLWLLKVPGVTGCLNQRYPESAAPNDEAFLIHDERASRKRSRAVLRVLRRRSGQRRLGVRKAGESLASPCIDPVKSNSLGTDFYIEYHGERK